MARVLLAEDDETMVGLLKTLLKMDGFEVVAVDDDDDVLSVVQQQRPDYLVLDVHLSHQNGLDILDAVRQTEWGHRVHIVVMSGLNVKDESLRRGADNFLMKPFMPDDLLKLLRRNVQA